MFFFRRALQKALTIKGIFIFVFGVMASILVFAVLVSAPFSRFTARSVFPGYVMTAHERTPMRNVDLPDITPYVQERKNEEHDESEEDIIITLENILSFKNFDIVRKKLYNIDRTAYVYDYELDFQNLLAQTPDIDIYGEKPKVLIFHTHASEKFADSREGVQDDTIVGVGAVLASILQEKYGVSVLHHKGVYDMVDGKIMRGNSYENMENDVLKILDGNPSIEVLIDLHRDALPEGKRLLTEIDGNKTAQIMFVNGICRLNEGGVPVPTEGLENEYITENLSFSLLMKLLINEEYPDFARKNYIKPYRYSLNMKPYSLLVEVGSDANTVEEAKNAMGPLANILIRAFS